jgi:hypothetical protein
VPVTGDLEQDLTAYVRQLLAGIRGPRHLAFFAALQSAARQATTAEKITDIVAPRLS